MLVVTTPTVEGMPIKQYIGMVTGETFARVNMFKVFAAGLESSYENEFANAARTAVNEMCTRAQSMGVHVDYFPAGADNAMLAAIATGTAVVL